MLISICNGRLIDPAAGIDAEHDLHIAQGQVVAVGEAPDGFIAEHVIDARGKVVAPGFVDLNAFLPAPQYDGQLSLESEALAAARAGVTTLCFPPSRDNILDTRDSVRQLTARADLPVRIVALGALTAGLQGEALSDMAALHQAGCMGLSNGDVPITNSNVLRHCFEFAASFNIPIIIYPQDPDLAAGGCMHEGEVSTRLGLPGIPATAETVAIARDLELIKQTGVTAHFAGLSSADAVKLIGQAREDKLPVSADVAAYQLYLTELDVDEFNSDAHVLPPLRSLADQAALQRGVAESVITLFSSHHRPCEAVAKRAPFAETMPGISALDTLLPLSLRLVNEGILALSDVIARLTTFPANLLRLDAGRLTVGATADVCIFDPAAAWTLNAETMASQGHNTPLLGWEMQGKVTHTLLGGQLVYQAD